MTYQTDIMGFTDGVLRNTSVPRNTINKVLVTNAEGKYEAHGLFKKGSIIETDAELEKQKGLVESFGDVFNYWKRLSRGGLVWTDSYAPAELNGWKYISETDSIQCTINSAWLVGFVSPEQYDNYVWDAQLSSNVNDDDWIGMVIAYAFEPATGRTHTLTACRVCNGAPPLVITKNLGMGNGINVTLAYRWNGLNFPNGTVAEPGKLGGNWDTAPYGCRLKVTRVGDIITVETSQFNQTALFEPAKIIIDLAADPQLEVFRGPQSYGYCAVSQAGSTWKVSERPSVRYPIIDIRDWSVWNYGNSVWSKVNSSKTDCIQKGFLRPSWMHQNETTGKYFYMDPQQKLYRL